VGNRGICSRQSRQRTVGCFFMPLRLILTLWCMVALVCKAEVVEDSEAFFFLLLEWPGV
jgi:hypothetical protein